MGLAIALVACNKGSDKKAEEVPAPLPAPAPAPAIMADAASAAPPPAPVTMIWKDVPSLGVKISVPDDVAMVSIDATKGGIHYGSPEEDRARVFHFSLYPANRRAASVDERKQDYTRLPGFKSFIVERADGDTWHLEVAHEDVKDRTPYVSFSIRIAAGGALIDCESTERAPDVAARIVAACKTIQPMR